MPVEWECGKCEAHKVALVSAHKSGGFNSDDEVWSDYCYLREALIWGLLAVRFPPKDWKITEDNWRDVFRRLHILEKVNGAYRSFNKKGDVYFKPEEIHSMIGLSVNCGTRTEAEFKKYIFKLFDEGVTNSLRRFDKEKQNEISSRKGEAE